MLLDRLCLGRQVCEVSRTTNQDPLLVASRFSLVSFSPKQITRVRSSFLAEDCEIHLPDGAERNDALTLLLDEFTFERRAHADSIWVYVQGFDGAFTHIDASDKDNVDNPAQSLGIAGALSHVALGIPDGSHATLAVNEARTFVFAVHEDHAELIYTAHLFYGASTKIESPAILADVDDKSVTVISSKTFSHFDPFLCTVAISWTVEEIGSNVFADVTGG